jgi:16S rRNA (guanine527-N7)-methyltransferase
LPIEFSDKKILDLGTGAGFPGVPLKIYDRSIDIDLLDSLNKRIKYLMVVGEELGFKKVKYSHMRAEDGAKKDDMRGSYDIVVSRAVANLSTLCEYCLPFVKEGGYFIAQKGPKCEDEIEAAKNAISILGGEIEKVVEVKIPYSENTHFLLMIKKISPTPIKYPRKAGVPSKSPL